MYERVTDWTDPSEMLKGMMIERTVDVLGDMAKVFLRDLMVIKRTKCRLRPGSNLRFTANFAIPKSCR